MAATYTVRGGLRSYFGTSRDKKENGGVPNGSSFTEMDTGARFLFDEQAGIWRRQPAAGGSGSGGVADHRELAGRDAAGQHPMSAVTGLEDALAGKVGVDDLEEISGQDVAELWHSLAPDSGGSSGTGGTADHRNLMGRDAEGQHPIRAISGLAEALAAKAEAGAVEQAIAENVQEISEQDVLNIWNQVMSV